MPTPTPQEREALARAVALDDDALRSECEESFFVASGPGGQHRNKTSTAVRLVHRPSGVQVTATERRSQLMNREAALERLRDRLRELAFVPEVRKATRVPRGAKRRRLADKRHHAERKQARKGDW
jgi:protein subunit release factor B